MDILTIIVGIISILFALLSPYIVKFLKSRIDENNLETIFTIAANVVFGLEEEIKGEKKGEERYEKAVEIIKSSLQSMGISANNNLISAAIHYGVSLLHRRQMEDQVLKEEDTDKKK